MKLCLFVCLFVLNDRPKGTRNNPFGHSDLQALPCSGLQQADARPLSTNFYIIQKISLKTIYVLTNHFWMVKYLL